LALDEAKGTAVTGVTCDDILASVRANNLDAFDATENKFKIEKIKLGNELLNVLNSPQSSNLEQCAAAYYAGEKRTGEAVDILTSKIQLWLDHPIDHSTVLDASPAAVALTKIGTPSIPAVIRKLSETDEPEARKVSLEVLVRIEMDKDVVQLRLEKALRAEKDRQKQARLRTALKKLPEIKFLWLNNRL